jgi:PAS domain S-box-containing protein
MNEAVTLAPSSFAHHPGAGGAVGHRLRFESFLFALSAAFAKTSGDRVHEEIRTWLGKLARFIRVDRISLWECTPDGSRGHAVVHCVSGEAPPPTGNIQTFPWLTEQYRQGVTVVLRRIPDDIPTVAVAERAAALRVGARSMLGIPLRFAAGLYVIEFISLSRGVAWRPATIRRLRLVGEIISSSLLRRRAELHLQSSELRNRALLQAVPDTMFICSRDGIYLDYVSREPHGPAGSCECEAILGRRIEEVLPASVAALLRNAFRRAVNSHQCVELEYAVPSLGGPRHYELRIVSREDGALVCIERDLTERRRAQVRLRESEERFRAAFDHSAIGIALVALDGRWLHVNAALCRILGYDERTLRTLDFQTLTHPEDRADNLVLLRRALAGEIDHYELEKRYIHRDGRTISALLTASIVRDAGGTPLYFVSQIQDMTERLQAQTQIGHLRAELAHVGRVNLLGHLTASLAHQLLQPITAIVANAEAGQHLMQSAEPDAGDLRSILADIAESANGAAEVIHGVTGLLRKESRPFEPLDLNCLVRNVVDVTRSDLILRNVRLVANLNAMCRRIMGDPVQLQQVVLNLLLNGAEAMTESAQPERVLTVSTSDGDQEIELAVCDHGTGVEPRHLHRIFNPFFTTKPDGLGMGLHICSEIVRTHGGRLWAENNEGPGLTVHCCLPLPAESRVLQHARTALGARVDERGASPGG